jgi:tetratricopeptide (TPR) repeat protein
MPKDSLGLTITGSAASAEAFDRAVADYWGLTGDPVGRLSRAVDEDPSFALGATAIAALFLVGGFRGDSQEVTQALTAAQAAGNTTERELKHLAAVQVWAKGGLSEAAWRWEDILVDFPRDALALRLVQDAYFFLGDSLAIRDSLSRVKPLWDAKHPLYSFVLGAQAFGLEETGDLINAERWARKALELNAQDAWATHALAHVLETALRFEEGIAFLKQTHADWGQAHFMAGHNGWHLALYLIEGGRYQEVLDDWDRFAPQKLALDLTLDRVDAAALLWRLELAGVDGGDRWRAVAAAWMRHVDDHALAFNDLHLACAAARSPNPDDSVRVRDSLKAFIANASGDIRDTTAEVGAALVEGVLRFGEGDYRGALASMLPVARRAQRIGGSHAQRDLIAMTMIAAAERAGERNLSRALLAERRERRPTSNVRAAFTRAGAA